MHTVLSQKLHRGTLHPEPSSPPAQMVPLHSPHTTGAPQTWTGNLALCAPALRVMDPSSYLAYLLVETTTGVSTRLNNNGNAH